MDIDKIKISRQRTQCEHDYSNVLDIKNDIQNGIHYVEIDGVKFPFFWIKGTVNKLLVGYNDKRSQKSIKNRYTPIFFKYNFHKIFDGHILCFDDPSFLLYDSLSIGWYYGTESRSFIVDTVSIISHMQSLFNIHNKNVTIYSTSAGGYASIYASTLIPNSISLTINPHLSIVDQSKYTDFYKITDISLEKDDPFRRNDLLSQIKSNLDSSHLILFDNGIPAVQRQICYLKTDHNIYLKPGLTSWHNIIFWIYNCPFLTDNDSTYLSPTLFYIIQYLSDKFHKCNLFGSKTPISHELNTFVLMINELCNRSYINKTKLDNSIKLLNIARDTNLTLYPQRILFNLRTKVYEEENIEIGPSLSNNFHRDFDFLQDNSIITIKLIDIKGVDKLEVACFSFLYKYFLSKIVLNIQYLKEDAFITIMCGNNCGDVSVLFYAGEIGKTCNQFLTIGKMEVYIEKHPINK